MKTIRTINEDGYFSKEEEREGSYSKIIVYDGLGKLLADKADGLNYNIREKAKKNYDRLDKILPEVAKKLGLLLWADFTNPDNKLTIIDKIEEKARPSLFINKYLNVGETDSLIIENPRKILKDFGENSIFLGGAVADCATICSGFEDKILSITHAGWQGILNGVIEELIKYYSHKLSKSELKNVEFNFSPMAGVNYEWEIKFFDKDYLSEQIYKLEDIFNKILENALSLLIKEKADDLVDLINKSKGFFGTFSDDDIKDLVDLQFISFKYKDSYNELLQNLKYLENQKSFYDMILKFHAIIEKYNLDFVKDKIAEINKSDRSKANFYLDRLIRRIFLENGIDAEQLYFYGAYTTDLNNKWPSYRIHTLFHKGIIPASATKKNNNGIVYDSRIGVFNGLYFK